VRRVLRILGVMCLLVIATTLCAQTVSKGTFDVLAAARKSIDRGRPGEAVKPLSALLDQVGNNAYERALTLQMLGHAQAGAGDLKSAARSFRAAIDSGRLPSKDAASTRYNLAQILINDGQYQEGLGHLEASGRGGRDAHALAAVAYERTGNCKAAIPHLQVLAREKGKESAKWSQALVACQAKAGQFGAVAQSLEDAVRRNPDDTEAWLQLAAAYQRANNLDRAIATYEVLAARSSLDAGQLVTLARLYLAGKVPLKAASLLRTGIESGRLPADRANRQLLVDSLLMAHESDAAAEVLTSMLKEGDDGELWHQLGRIQFDQQKWTDAAASLQKAVGSRTIKDASGANLLLGIAAMQVNDTKVAEQSLRIAAGDNDTREQAEWWLQRLRRQQQPAPAADLSAAPLPAVDGG
jgi:tetratricopeptide (TPR) repeat protein